MTIDKLKPCQFCGSKDIASSHTCEVEDFIRWHTCLNCFSEGGRSKGDSIKTLSLSKRRWNRRSSNA